MGDEMILKTYAHKDVWNEEIDTSLDSDKTLLLLFGGTSFGELRSVLAQLKGDFPSSLMMGSSTAGEIFMDELYENSLVLAVMKFEHTKLHIVNEKIDSMQNSFGIGESIAKQLESPELRNIFVLSDGLNINGSKLTNGIASVTKEKVVVSGGLAGDGDKFHSTWVIIDGEAKEGYVSAIGFYGEHIHVGHGFRGGWDKFGIQRRVTRSVDNVLYELDGKPALDIYKIYLAEKAKELPASGLLFPLELQEDETSEVKTVRTILAVDEDTKSITFAGDIPEGSMVSLMKANHDRLIDGAYKASKEVDLQEYKGEDILCIAISCIGRKLVLKQRVEDELEATLKNLPSKTRQIGFYSYGEISPISSGECDLHNQTMTLTLLWESDASST